MCLTVLPSAWLHLVNSFLTFALLFSVCNALTLSSFLTLTALCKTLQNSVYSVMLYTVYYSVELELKSWKCLFYWRPFLLVCKFVEGTCTVWLHITVINVPLGRVFIEEMGVNCAPTCSLHQQRVWSLTLSLNTLTKPSPLCVEMSENAHACVWLLPWVKHTVLYAWLEIWLLSTECSFLTQTAHTVQYRCECDTAPPFLFEIDIHWWAMYLALVCVKPF